MPAGGCGGRLPSLAPGAGALDATGAITDNFGKHTTRRSITLEARNVEALPEGLERRLVLAADADRRTLERELHDGVQQHLVALAVNLQLAAQSLAADPAAAR